MTGHVIRRRLNSDLLLRAYGAGLFPMADTRDSDSIFWVEPRRRGILPLDQFHLSRSLQKNLKQERFIHTKDCVFEAVMRSCAARAAGREESWINSTIIDAYLELHLQGQAHSVETWDSDGRLVGGLYGVRLGSAFFGESMFSRATDASKAAFAHLVARLRVGKFCLLDTQFLTSHLASFGGVEVKRSDYVELLRHALTISGDWTAMDLAKPGGGAPAVPPILTDLQYPPLGQPVDVRLPEDAVSSGVSGKLIVQLLSQTS